MFSKLVVCCAAVLLLSITGVVNAAPTAKNSRPEMNPRQAVSSDGGSRKSCARGTYNPETKTCP